MHVKRGMGHKPMDMPPSTTECLWRVYFDLILIRRIRKLGPVDYKSLYDPRAHEFADGERERSLRCPSSLISDQRLYIVGIPTSRCTTNQERKLGSDNDESDYQDSPMNFISLDSSPSNPVLLF